MQAIANANEGVMSATKPRYSLMVYPLLLYI
jgi:hypothetical protein